MDSERKFWLWIVSLIVGGCLVLGLGAYYISMEKDVAMAELGFQRTTIVGHGPTIYQKINED